ncbi:hypothetical protein HK097_003405 [Rhizophlyctis rosea]|uniref:Histidine kinase n=1 Tax=Rhizophlyctis rosea TaxID=64517 RepID=A0AAD5SLA6_9FUNG|nr:hypothetical protein HK097_003405 [Rhizophlyctis rosea]
MNLEVAVVALDKNCQITFINHSAKRLLEISQDDEVSGSQSAFHFGLQKEFYTMDGQRITVEQDVSLLQRLARGERVNDWEMKMKGKKGWKRIWGAGGPFYDAKGEILGSSAVFWDISDRWQSEQDRTALKSVEHSYAQFRELAESIPHLVYIYDLEGKILFANGRWQETCGFSPQEFNHLSFLINNYVHPDDVRRLQGKWKEEMLQDKALKMQFRLTNKDGNYRWYIAGSTPILDPATGEILKRVGSMTDIHNEHLALEAARDAHAQFRSFIASARVIVWAVSASGHITFCEGQGMSSLHLWDEYPVGSSIHDTFRNEPAILNLVSGVLSTGEATEQNVMMHGRHFNACASPLYEETEESERKKMKGCVCAMTDITQLMNAQVALEESELRAKQMIESALVGIVVYDRAGQVHEVNNAYLSICGYSRKEIDDIRAEGKKLVRPLSLDMWAFSSIDESHMSIQFEKDIARRDGTVKPVLVGIAPLVAGKGQFASFLVDLTQQKTLWQKLVDTERRLRSVVNNIADLFLWTVDGNFRLTLADGKGLKNLGIDKPNTFLGQHISCIFGATPELESCLARAAEGESFVTTLEHQGRWLETHFSSLEESEGGVKRVAGITADVTTRKLQEAELRKALMERSTLLAREATAQEASKLKSDFLATMSHEIRTPISGVIGLTELLLESKLDEEQLQHAHDIRLSAHSLLTVINDILDWSKVEAGKLDLDPGPFESRELVRDVVKIVASAAAKKNIKIKTEMSGCFGTMVGDAGRIRQVLINLLSNAIKFTSPLGEVTMILESLPDLPTLRLKDPAQTPLHTPKRHIRFTVRDNGIGMSAAVVNQLFQPFTQAEASTARRFGGTGLGLSISKRLVELMGGSIRVESVEGHGSMFVVDLPLEPVQSSDHGLHTRSKSCTADIDSLKGCRILLAEDNKINQVIARKMLQKLGVEFTIVSSGLEALNKITSDPHFDIVLMDCQMPEMDGYECTRAIRKLLPPVGMIPIIAMSANVLEGDKIKCWEAGMSDHVGKPVDLEKLADALKRWFRKCHQERSEQVG